MEFTDLLKIKVNLEPLRYASQEYHKKNENDNDFPSYELKPVLHVPATILSLSMVVGCGFHPVKVQLEDVYSQLGCLYNRRIKSWLKS